MHARMAPGRDTNQTLLPPAPAVDQLKTTTPYPKQNYPMRGPGRPPKGF